MLINKTPVNLKARHDKRKHNHKENYHIVLEHMTGTGCSF